MKILKLISRQICGFLLIPFLYVRFSFVFFLPFFASIKAEQDILFAFYFICTSLLCFLMGMCGLMGCWTRFLVWVFGVEYIVKSQNRHHETFLYCEWDYLELTVRQRKYNVWVILHGGKLYENDTYIRRKAIMLWLLG